MSHLLSYRTATPPASKHLKPRVEAKGDCVVIKANSVTLDLGGRVLMGNGQTGKRATGTRHGVVATGNGAEFWITVRNGTIKAVNAQGGLGRWCWAVSHNPADIKDILAGLNFVFY